MGEVNPAFVRAANGFTPTEHRWEGLVRLAGRRQRNRRIGSALLAMAVFAATDVVLLRAFQPAGAHPVPGTGVVVVPGSTSVGQGVGIAPSLVVATGPNHHHPPAWSFWHVDGFGRTGPTGPSVPSSDPRTSSSGGKAVPGHGSAAGIGSGGSSPPASGGKGSSGGGSVPGSGGSSGGGHGTGSGGGSTPPPDPPPPCWNWNGAGSGNHRSAGVAQPDGGARCVDGSTPPPSGIGPRRTSAGSERRPMAASRPTAASPGRRAVSGPRPRTPRG